MLMSLDKLVDKYNMNIRGVIHVGAHLAEEAEDYFRHGDPPVLWIEANPHVIPRIERVLGGYENQAVVQALVYSVAGEVLDFNVTNYDGMSSSIFEFGTHPQFSPDTVFVDKLQLPTKTIDTVVAEEDFESCFNFLNMDLQGAELHALRGASETLKHVHYIVTEVNKAEVYKGAAQVHELDEHLAEFGMRRVETSWALSSLSRSRGRKDDGWGDALYVRESLL